MDFRFPLLCLYTNVPWSKLGARPTLLFIDVSNPVPILGRTIYFYLYALLNFIYSIILYVPYISTLSYIIYLVT